jgi:hypothetical protein
MLTAGLLTALRRGFHGAEVNSWLPTVIDFAERRNRYMVFRKEGIISYWIRDLPLKVRVI